jgi:trimethylamine--corrinoid protein Co-methyltransferase
MMMAAMAGANYITCVGTLESTLAGGHELAVIDNELIGMTRRALNGIEVTDDKLALDVIKQVGPTGTYIMEAHTLEHFRNEQYFSKIVDQDKREAWERGGKRGLLEKARDEARKILSNHQAKELDPNLLKELDDYVKMTAARDLEEFYTAEWEA